MCPPSVSCICRSNLTLSYDTLPDFAIFFALRIFAHKKSRLLGGISHLMVIAYSSTIASLGQTPAQAPHSKHSSGSIT
jgi:hypothetical protein